MGHKNIGNWLGGVCRHLLRIRDDDFSLSLYWLLPNACWCCCAVSIVELWHFHSVGVDLLENNILSPFICLEFGMSLQQSIFRLCVFFKEKPDTPNHVSISFLVKITCHFYGGGTLPEKKTGVYVLFLHGCWMFQSCLSLWKKGLTVVHKSHPTMNFLSGWPLDEKYSWCVVLLRVSPSLLFGLKKMIEKYF